MQAEQQGIQIRVEDVPANETGLRTVAAVHSLGIGQGFRKCSLQYQVLE